MRLLAFLILLLAGIEVLFGPQGVISTFWFVMAEIAALYLMWRSVYVRD